MKKGAEYAMNVQGIKKEDMTPEMEQKIRELIRSS
jgi:hypothetical protein